MMMDCIFCSIAQHPEWHSNPEDEILATSCSFIAKPALGHFVEGYTLILSKRHYLNLSSMGIGLLAELETLKNYLATTLSSMYGLPVIAFEHGIVNPEYRAGCCHDHAHMHLVPLAFDVNELLLLEFEFDQISRYIELAEYHRRNQSYIYYESTIGDKLVFRVNGKIPSQYIRRIICKSMGIPDAWNWYLNPFRDKIERFKRAYEMKGAHALHDIAAGAKMT